MSVLSDAFDGWISRIKGKFGANEVESLNRLGSYYQAQMYLLDQGMFGLKDDVVLNFLLDVLNKDFRSLDDLAVYWKGELNGIGDYFEGDILSELLGNIVESNYGVLPDSELEDLKKRMKGGEVKSGIERPRSNFLDKLDESDFESRSLGVGGSSIRPSHYRSGSGLEAADVMEMFMDPVYVLGGYITQSLQYMLRLGKKDDMLQELEKAQWFLGRAIEVVRKMRALGLDVSGSGGVLWSREDLLKELEKE